MSHRPATSQLKLSQRVALAIGPLVIRLLALTWRIRTDNYQPWADRRLRKDPSIAVLWHGEMLPLLYHHRGRGIAILISEHRDGEMIARIARSFGLKTLRGSTSRGAARALLAMNKALEEGNDIAITPDGPRGPAKSVAPGALIVAQRSGKPLIPMAVYASRAWRLKSWDSFLIPKPFASVYIAYADPVYIDAPDSRAAASETQLLSDGMLTAYQKAEELGAGKARSKS